MDRQHINSTLLNATLHMVQAVSRLEGYILQEFAAAREWRAQQRPCAAGPSPSSSMERLAKLSTNLVAIATAIGKLWGPALVLLAAAWKWLGPWVRSVLGFG